jgi:hypothetical protein
VVFLGVQLALVFFFVMQLSSVYIPIAFFFMVLFNNILSLHLLPSGLSTTFFKISSVSTITTSLIKEIA